MVKNNEWKSEKLDDCQLQLRSMVDQYANDCSSGEMQFYNPEAKNYYEPYDWDYCVNRLGEMEDVMILLAGGGPTIWLNTREGVVEGYWGSDSYKKPIYDYEHIIEYFAEHYNAMESQKAINLSKRGLL